MSWTRCSDPVSEAHGLEQGDPNEEISDRSCSAWRFGNAVLAAEGFYIVFANTTKKCTMMNEAYRHEPLQDDGHLGEAKAAVAGIKECKM